MSSDHLESARRLLEEHKYGAALREVDGTDAEDGPDGAVLTARGRALAGLGDLTGALACFDEALRLDERDTEAASEAGGVLLQLAVSGRSSYVDAEVAYERAARLPGATPDVLVGLGRTLLAQGKLEQARWQFDDAIARGAGADAYRFAGQILLEQGRYANAAERMQQAVEANRESAEAWNDWGHALAELGERDTALERVRIALRLDPDLTAGHALLGRLFVELERWEDALDPLRRTIELEVRRGSRESQHALTARWYLTRVLIELRNYGEAADVADELIRRLEDITRQLSSNGEGASDARAAVEQWLAAAYSLRAVANNGRRRYDEAVSDTREAARVHPQFAGHAFWLAGLVRYQQGDYKEAWTEIAEVREVWRSVRSDHDELHPDDLRMYASALQSLGCYADAAELYLEAAQKAPDDSRVWAELAALNLVRDEYPDLCAQELNGPAERNTGGSSWYGGAREAAARAESLLQAQLAQEPSANTALALGHLYVLLDEYKDAKHYLSQALSLDPGSALAHANLATAYSAEKQYGKAAECLAASLRREPHDLSVRVKLAEVNLRLEVFDEAEAHYRQVLRTTRGNVEAHAGLGEVLTRIADRGGEPELYEDAIAHFIEAEALATSMKSEVAARRGSSRLSATQLASVLYGRGYARVKLYEARLDEGLRSRRGNRRLLAEASADFAAAIKVNRDHFKAQRAHEKVERWRKPGVDRRLLEELAPLVVVSLTLCALLALQLIFFTGWPVRPTPAEWLVGTLGLLLFVFAGLSLPQLLKLKVGGIELERSAVEPGVPTSLGISSESISISRGGFQPSYPAPKLASRPDASESLRAAHSGFEASQEGHDPRPESQRAAEEGVDRAKRRS
jgi:tetratricopeptide (TPR) repeat protein